jgi:hypothetical protein
LLFEKPPKWIKELPSLEKSPLHSSKCEEIIKLKRSSKQSIALNILLPLKGDFFFEEEWCQS